MAVKNGRRATLQAAGVGAFEVGVRAAPEGSGAAWEVAWPDARGGRQLAVGAVVQLAGEQLRVLSCGASPISRGFLVATLGPVA